MNSLEALILIESFIGGTLIKLILFRDIAWAFLFGIIVMLLIAIILYQCTDKEGK